MNKERKEFYEKMLKFCAIASVGFGVMAAGERLRHDPEQQEQLAEVREKIEGIIYDREAVHPEP